MLLRNLLIVFDRDAVLNANNIAPEDMEEKTWLLRESMSGDKRALTANVQGLVPIKQARHLRKGTEGLPVKRDRRLQRRVSDERADLYSFANEHRLSQKGR